MAHEFLLDCIAELGYTNSTVYVKNDQEPAIQAVIQAVVQGRSAQTLIEESPVGSSASNGDVENAVQAMEKGVRRLRASVENRYKIKLSLDSDVIPWLVIHAGFVYNRFQIGFDGKTPYQRIRGKTFDKALCEFGECVHYKIPKRLIGPELNKWDNRWEVNVFLGIRSISNEMYVGTNTGIIKCRTIRRKTFDQRWIVDVLTRVRGLPWDFKAGELREPSAQEQLQPLPENEVLPPPEAINKDVIHRSFKIFRQNIIDREASHGDGYTVGCPGCLAVRRNQQPKNHTPICRERYRKIFNESDRHKQRVELADKRLTTKPTAAETEVLQDTPAEVSADVPARLPKSAPSASTFTTPPHYVPPEFRTEVDPYQVEMQGEDDQAFDIFMGDQGESPEPVPAPAQGRNSEETMDVGLLASIAIEYIKFGKHVAEIYSPPRVTKVASKIGLRTGFALDLSVNNPISDKPWDFNDESMCAQAEQMVDEQRPLLLIGSPPCRAFNSLFSSNISRMKPEVVRGMIREGIKHVLFCVKLYRKQMSAGRYFLHEHPWGAWSWSLPEVRKLRDEPTVKLAKGNMCAQGTKLRDSLGEAPVLKATGWLSNCDFI